MNKTEDYILKNGFNVISFSRIDLFITRQRLRIRKLFRLSESYYVIGLLIIMVLVQFGAPYTLDLFYYGDVLESWFVDRTVMTLWFYCSIIGLGYLWIKKLWRMIK